MTERFHLICHGCGARIIARKGVEPATGTGSRHEDRAAQRSGTSAVDL